MGIRMVYLKCHLRSNMGGTARVTKVTGTWALRSLRAVFPGSSTVEHAAVNRTVVGSTPTLGACP